MRAHAGSARGCRGRVAVVHPSRRLSQFKPDRVPWRRLKSKNFFILSARGPLQTTAMFSPSPLFYNSLVKGPKLVSQGDWPLSCPSQNIYMYSFNHITTCKALSATPETVMYNHSPTGIREGGKGKEEKKN